MAWQDWYIIVCLGITACGCIVTGWYTVKLLHLLICKE